MRKLSTIVASALVVATAGAALPAQAQPYPDRSWDGRHDRDGRYDRYDRYDGYRGNAQSIRAQIEELQRRVERTDARDRVSEREAAGLRRDVYRLRQQFWTYNRNGLSQREVRYLQDRIRDIRQRLRYERRDNDGRRW
jgi:hypothetical protein